MKRIIITALTLTLMGYLFFACAPTGEIVVEHQLTGAYTNAFLIYDTGSKEAALVDVGGPVDSLLAIMERDHLKLKYFFFTHGHVDHVMGLPALRDRFPDAQVCLHRLDYEDLLVQVQWIFDNLPPEEIESWKEDAEVAKLLEFDAATFGEPDIYLEENQTYRLGRHEIKTYHTPGHSRGSISFHVGNILFSGDLLMYHTVGRENFQNTSTADMVASVRRLYELFPDETEVYPGHGPPTTIGAEKIENTKISADNSVF